MLSLLVIKKDSDAILKEIFEYHTGKGEAGDFVDDFIKFWQKSYNHFNIIMLLGSVNTDSPGYAYEEICDLYPKKFAGRTTILSILNEGCEKNFFIKRVSLKDHRKHNYKLNPNQKKDVVQWINKHPISNMSTK